MFSLLFILHAPVSFAHPVHTVSSDCHIRFGSGGGVGDLLTDYNLGGA